MGIASCCGILREIFAALSGQKVSSELKRERPEDVKMESWR
jgi:hypothetical protein